MVNYSLTELKGLAWLQYLEMTFPSYQPALQSVQFDDSIIAIGASVEQKPVGLGLARFYPEEEAAIILSIFVEFPYRCQGIGTALLAYLEQVFKQRGCRYVELVYTSDQTTTPSLEHILKKAGWTPPELRVLICKAIKEQMIQASWLHKYSLPAGFTIFPWSDLTEAERSSILEKQNTQAWYPEVLSPFLEEDKIEPLNSLGLRYQKEVIGWMITHRLAPDTIRYSSFFVKKELQKVGRGIPLLAESIKIQCSSHIPYGMWTVAKDNPAMLSFVKRRMASYMMSIKESRGVSKVL